jgi:hypothetical protein
MLKTANVKFQNPGFNLLELKVGMRGDEQRVSVRSILNKESYNGHLPHCPDLCYYE